MSAAEEEKTDPSFSRPDFTGPHATPPAPFQTIAFVDIESTGLDPERHEILEVGIVRVDPRTLEVVDEFSTLARPEHLETADPTALSIAGFTAAAWEKAPPLAEALAHAMPFLEGTIVAGHNVGFDWSFITTGLRAARLPLPRVDYHRLDTASVGWPLYANGEVESLSLNSFAKHFGLERPTPHRALADARVALAIARRLLERMVLGGRLVRLPGDEREIMDALSERLNAGRQAYGPWHVNDGRDYPAEAFAEVLDALHYTAAALVRHRRLTAKRMPRIYICHPFADNVPVNKARLRALCHCLVERGALPVAPQLYLPEFVDEEVEQNRTRALCLELVNTCDEVRIFGDQITDDMMRVLRYAKARDIPVRFEREVFA